MKIYDLNLPDHFCPQPFTYLYAAHSGSWKPCCKVHVYPDKSDITFDEWWHEDKDLKDLRNALLNEEVTPILENICAPCRVPESLGVKSYRQHELNKFNDIFASDLLAGVIKSYKKTEYVMLPEGQRLFTLKVRGFGNQCNLKCYMCYPTNSSSRINEMRNALDESVKLFFETEKPAQKVLEIERKKVLDIDAEKSRVYEAIESVSSNISQINFAGGEPVMIEEYYNLMDKFIESGDAKDVTVYMSSNLSKLGFKDKSILDYINKFKKFHIDASIDDVGERDEWIRYPSKFNEVLENYKTLAKHPNVKLGVNVTWSILNIANAENILKLIKDNEMKFNNNLNFVMSPKQLSIKNYPFKDELIEKYSAANDDTLNQLAKALSDEFVQEEFDSAIRYIKDLDRIRKTKSYKVFPELSQFLT
jgi:sulfatase maturation enzyme AslB (radical SAM superfamily)